MPRVVSAARYIITFQVALEIVGLLLLGSLLFAGGIDWLAGAILSGGIAITILMGWLMGRFATRKRPIRWSMIAIEGVAAGAYATPMAIDSDVTIVRALSPSVLLPAAVILLLLLPAAGKWFDR